MNVAKRHNYTLWLLIAIQLGLLVFFAFNRLVDGDEGFYLSAAREVAQGRLLYVDFFYPQMPYLPYIFSVFAGHGFATLFMTRLASVLVALLTTLLFYSLLKKLTGDRTTINIVMAMYVFSGMVISWHSVAKTFAWTDFFLLGAFYTLVMFLRSPRLWHLAVCGALLALAVNTRLVFMPLIILFYIPIIIHSGRQWLKRSLAYLIPMLIFAIPSFLYLLRDARRFMFDNLGFHFIRNPLAEFPETLFQRLFVIGKLLVNPQILIILIAVVGTYLLWRRTRGLTGQGRPLSSTAGLAGMSALVITIIYLLPSPVLQQYFVQAVPFALISAVGGIEYFVSRTRQGGISDFRRRLPAVLTAIYILGIIPYFVVYIGAVRDFDSHTDIGNMKRVCACLNQSIDNDPILSELPIISVLANKPAIDGIEFLGFEYPLPLNAEEKEYYRFVLNKDLKRVLDNKQVSYYVVVNDPPEELGAAISANYQLEGTFERFRVYRRKS